MLSSEIFPWIFHCVYLRDQVKSRKMCFFFISNPYKSHVKCTRAHPLTILLLWPIIRLKLTFFFFKFLFILFVEWIIKKRIPSSWNLPILSLVSCIYIFTTRTKKSLINWLNGRNEKKKKKRQIIMNNALPRYISLVFILSSFIN